MKHDEMTMPELLLDMNTKLGILYLNFGENINYSAVHDTKISCLLGYTQRAKGCISNLTQSLQGFCVSEIDKGNELS